LNEIKSHFSPNKSQLNFIKMTIKTILRPALLLLIVTCISACEPEDDIDTGDPRNTFTGTWRFTETPAAKNPDVISFTVTISNDPDNSSQVLLRNFAQLGGQYSPFGIVTSNRITIPSQEVTPGFIVSGKGTLSGTNNMDWEYTTIAGGEMESFTAVASR
jgi:hypothetical protein